MSADFATIQISGRLTSDPKVFKAGEGNKVVFSVAVNRNIKEKGSNEFTKKTTFVDCVAWGFPGDHVAQYGKKGVKITLTGDFEDDRYETKDTKETITRKQVKVQNVSIFSANENEGVKEDRPAKSSDSAKY